MSSQEESSASEKRESSSSSESSEVQQADDIELKISPEKNKGDNQPEEMTESSNPQASEQKDQAPLAKEALTADKQEPAKHASFAEDSSKAEAMKSPSQRMMGGVSMQLTRKEFVLTLLGLTLGMLLAFLDSTIVSTALPKIASDLGDFNKISWVISAYLLSSTAVTPVYGRLSDILGRKRMFIIAISIFGLSSLMCGLAPSMIVLILGRALQGMGGGGLMSLVMIVIGDIIPPRERGKYQGMISGTFAVASVAGPLMGGGFTDTIGWRWCFYINLPLSAIAAAVVIIGLKNTPIKMKEVNIDFLGIITLVIAVVMGMLAVSWGGVTYAWDNVIIIMLFVITVIFGVAFIFIEQKVAKMPVMPLRVLTLRNVWVCVGGAFVVGVSMFATTTYLPLYFQIVRGIDPTDSGLSLLPTMAGVVVGSMAAGTITSKTGKYRWIPAIGAALFTLADGLYSILDQNTSLGAEIPILFIGGTGIGMCFPVMLIAAQNAIEMKDMAAVTTSIGFFRNIGGVIGVTVYQSMLSNEMQKRINIPGVDASNISPQVLGYLPASEQELVVSAYQESLSRVWLYFIAFNALGVIVFAFMKHQPLRRAGQPPATPTPSSANLTAAPPKTTIEKIENTIKEVAGEVTKEVEEAAEMAGGAEAFG